MNRASQSAVMSTYGRYPVAFVRGEGCRLWDEAGREYIDFLAGIGVNNLGHCHPSVVKAVQEQSARLIHTSNLYWVPNQEALAEKLTSSCFADQVFFCNSGAEANEAAIKLARKYMRDNGHPGRFEIITTHGGFHGRTLATLTATAQEKVQRGFDPLMPGFRYVPFNDIQAIERAISSYTAAILVEPIQGEGGVVIPDDGYLDALREIADRHELLVILDEVQTGMGRTGRLWGHHWSGMVPDIMTSAKGIASGLPMGACLAKDKVADSFTPGTHGTTFGGNPLSAAAALATFSVMTQEGMLEEVAAKGAYLLARLNRIKDRFKLVKEARCRGLMAALELNTPAEEVVATALSRGLLMSCQMGTILRFLPPLTVTREEIDRAMDLLEGVLNDHF
ncbi:MAG: aspartate aminotransferase family protein [Magnetococcales bacterium]|nr:aspartate aminotransferase family protein [Magnetococcales bacterium]